MFRPNLRGTLWKRLGSRDIFGKEAYSAPTSFRYAVVHLKEITQQTTVRADSSASRGAAEDAIANANILVPPDTNIKKGDKVEVHSVMIEVSSLEPRFNTRGRLDHYQLLGMIVS